jgi:hypothetical protein
LFGASLDDLHSGQGKNHPRVRVQVVLRDLYGSYLNN